MQAADGATLDRLFHADLLYAHASGTRESGATVLAKIRSGAARYSEIELNLDEVRVTGSTAVVFGDFCALLTTSEGEREIASRFTDVWVRSAEGWQLFAYLGAPPRP